MAEISTFFLRTGPGAIPGFIRRVVNSRVAPFLLWFGVIFLLKWPTLGQVPVWDNTMSVFPAAITLAGEGFDLGHLLAQPGFSEGGPNVHSISLITWMTAGVIELFEDTSTFLPILHLIHFVIAALAMTVVYQFGLLALSRPLAGLASVTVLLCPLLLTQTGFLYLEIPLLAATMLALWAWARGRLLAAALWAAVAVLVKEPGVIVGGGIFLATLATPQSLVLKVRNALLTVSPSAIFAFLIAGESDLSQPGSFLPHVLIIFTYLRNIPDLFLLIIVFIGASLTVIGDHRRADSNIERPELGMISLFISFWLFYLLVLPKFAVAPVLPRYFVQVIPVMLIGIVSVIETRLGTRRAAVLVLLIMSFFILNSGGRFYQADKYNNFALVERSSEYLGLLELHKKEILILENLDPDTPIFYSQPEHYRFTYPLMGYSRGPLPNGHSIRHEQPYNSGNLHHFPDEFYMLLNYPWLGGEVIQDISRQAEADPGRRVLITPIKVSGFESTLFYVSRVENLEPGAWIPSR